jgi:DNA repair protein RecO (recombination protein O)
MSNTVRVELEPGFILHSRSYRETSVILEVFTQGFGRAGLVARGARRPRSAMRGLLNPFQPLRLSWSGRGELATLRSVEPGGVFSALSGDCVMAGFYVNELLMKLLHRFDPHPNLFAHYAALLAKLASGDQLEASLRNFELDLLREIGYELNLECEAVTHEPLRDDQNYEFRIELGAVAAEQSADEPTHFSGADLLAIGRGDFVDAGKLRSAKRLLRNVLDYHLGGKGLQTRRIASAMKR